MLGSVNGNKYLLPNHRIIHTRVSDGDSQELVDHVANDLDRVVASLVANRVSDEEAAACQRRSSPDLSVVLVQVW